MSVKERLWPVAGLVVLVVLFFGPVLLSGRQFLPADILHALAPWNAVTDSQGVRNHELGDAILHIYPNNRLYADELRQGRLLLWNPYILAGQPVLANGLATSLYPVKIVLYYTLSASAAHDAFLVVHVFLAGLFAYLYLRSLDVGQAGASVGAAAWMFSGPVMVTLESEVIVPAAAWLPAVLWLIERGKTGARGAFVLAGIALGLALLGSWVQYGLFVIVVAALYLALQIAASTRQGATPTTGRLARGAIVTLGAGLALAAVSILPTIELAMQSHRATYVDAELWARRGVLPWSHLLTLLVPDLFGNPVEKIWFHSSLPGQRNIFYGELVIYLGVVPLALALLAVVARRTRETWFFVGVAVVSILYALGFPLTRPIAWLPFIGKLAPVRVAFVFVFATAMLAGLGCEVLKEHARARRGLRRALTAFAAIVCVVAVAGSVALYMGEDLIVRARESAYRARGESLAGLPPGSSPVFEDRSTRAGQFYLLIRKHFGVIENPLLYWGPAVVIVAIVLLRKLGPGVVEDRRVFALLPVVFLELAVPALRFNTVSERHEPYFVTPDIRRLQADPEPFRVMLYGASGTRAPQDHGARDGARGAVHPSTLMPFRVAELGGYEPLHTARINRFLSAMENSEVASLARPFDNWVSLWNYRSRWIDLANVKYVVARPGTDLVDARLKLVHDGGLRIYQNETVLPRAFLVSGYEVERDEPRILSRLAEPAFDFRRTVLLEEEPRAAPYCHDADASSVRVTRYSPGRVVVSAEIVGRAFLVLTEAYYPGWTVEVDGNRQHLYRADFAFQGVELGPGRHEVHFVFDPQSVTIGGAISTAAALASGIAIGVGMRTRSKSTTIAGA